MPVGACVEQKPSWHMGACVQRAEEKLGWGVCVGGQGAEECLGADLKDGNSFLASLHAPPFTTWVSAMVCPESHESKISGYKAG